MDVREGRKEQGASTLTMQLARSYFLDQEKTWRRKLAEVLITVELERRFTKQKILELYANEVYLGRRGSFSVHGFGQAARTYFNKEIKALTLDESALLVGMIQRPAYFNPFKYPERVKARRDLVLTMMVNNGYIDAAQAAQAAAAPIRLVPAENESSDAPYFVDLVNSEIDDELGERASKQDGARIYTSLDMALQREAVTAVREGHAGGGPQRTRRARKAVRGPDAAGGSGCPGSAHRRGAGPGRRTELRRFAAQPGARQAAARIVLQAFRLCGGDQHRRLRDRRPRSPLRCDVLDEPTTFRYKDDDV